MENTTQVPAEHPADTTAPISIRGVSKHFGAIHAVDGVDLDIRAGELFGLIGHNGAGKSTLFRMMLGLLPLTAGRILIDGQDNTGRHFRTVRRKIGYLPENVVLYDNLTGFETLAFFARLKHCDQANCHAVLEQVGLTNAADRRVREYSKGMRQRLGFAQALLGQPRILFLDEPTNGLDPEAIRAFYATLRVLRDRGVTVVLTSHILTEIQERVDRLAIMASGKIQSIGSVQTLRDDLRLPLRIDVSAPVELAGRLRDAIAGLDIRPVAADVGQFTIRCQRPQKMPILTLLSTFGDAVRDITVHEPSLEDVFFGCAD